MLAATILGRVSPKSSSSAVMTAVAMAAPFFSCSTRTNSMVPAEEAAILTRLLPTSTADSVRT